jgi:hypothetical protein
MPGPGAGYGAPRPYFKVTELVGTPACGAASIPQAEVRVAPAAITAGGREASGYRPDLLESAQIAGCEHANRSGRRWAPLNATETCLLRRRRPNLILNTACGGRRLVGLVAQ